MRVIPNSFAQKYDIDYQETFASIAKMNTFCMLLSLEANLICLSIAIGNGHEGCTH